MIDDHKQSQQRSEAMRALLLSGMVSFAVVSATASEWHQTEQQDKQKSVLDAQELLQRLSETGGRVALHKFRVGPKADRVRLLCIPRSALNTIRPTSLVVFKNLKGVVIINPAEGDRPEKVLTGCLVDGLQDLTKLEAAYRQAGWITEK